MPTEMDLLGMDKGQRQAWLRANRATLVVVGLTWLGMIAEEWIREGFPAFLVVMVPVFALVRLGFYLHYAGRSDPG